MGHQEFASLRGGDILLLCGCKRVPSGDEPSVKMLRLLWYDRSRNCDGNNIRCFIETVSLYIGLVVVVTLWSIVMIQYIPLWMFWKACAYLKGGQNLYDDAEGDLHDIQPSSPCDAATGSGVGVQ